VAKLTRELFPAESSGPLSAVLELYRVLGCAAAGYLPQTVVTPTVRLRSGQGSAPTRLKRFPQARYRKYLIVVYREWFNVLSNTMRENAHGETDPR
jgi:hypothetical protein